MPPELANPPAPPPAPPPGSPPITDAGNRYAQQLAAQRRLLNEARAGEIEQRVRHEATGAAFASLQLGRAAPPSQQSIRLLATAATRRLVRWQDPVSGGFDPDDRDTLMRQAAEIGLSREVAAQILTGVAEAFRNRPRYANPSARPGRRRRFRLKGVTIWLIVTAALLVVVQVGAVVLWLRVFA